MMLRRFTFNSVTSDMKIKRIEKADVDLYCIYCPETDECYYLNPKDYNRSVTLRVERPKNSQVTNVRFAADYRRVP